MATTPVVMKVQDYKDREVQMVSYEFDQETDREGQMTGIPRGGKIPRSRKGSERRYSRVGSLDVRPLPEEGRRDPVPGDKDPEGDEDH